MVPGGRGGDRFTFGNALSLVRVFCGSVLCRFSTKKRAKYAEKNQALVLDLMNGKRGVFPDGYSTGRDKRVVDPVAPDCLFLLDLR